MRRVNSTETPPKLVLFDMMETLLHHQADVKIYWLRLGELMESKGLMAAAEFNLAYAAWRASRGEAGPIEVSLRERLIEVVPELANQSAVVDQIVGTYMTEYEQRTVLCSGVEEMLSSLKGNVPLGVVSNFFVAGFPRRLLDRHGLIRYFDFVLDSAEVGHRKPAPEIYLAALDRAGISKDDAERVVFVGDNWKADVDGPRQIGMKSILYRDSGDCPEDCDVIRHWDEFRPRWHNQSEHSTPRG